MDPTHGYLLFLIADMMGSGTVTVEYCPTKKMITDFCTKPLPGRSMLLNSVSQTKPMAQDPRSVLRKTAKSENDDVDTAKYVSFLSHDN